MKVMGGFVEDTMLPFLKRIILKATTVLTAFFIFLLMFSISRRLFFFLNWDSPSDCVKSPMNFGQGFAISNRVLHSHSRVAGVFTPHWKEKSSFLRKEGRFYLVSSLSKHFIQVCFWGFPLVVFFPTSQNSCDRFYHFTN